MQRHTSDGSVYQIITYLKKKYINKLKGNTSINRLSLPEIEPAPSSRLLLPHHCLQGSVQGLGLGQGLMRAVVAHVDCSPDLVHG